MVKKGKSSSALVSIAETIVLWPYELYEDYKAKDSVVRLALIGGAAVYVMYIQTAAFNADAAGMLMGYALAGGVYYVGDKFIGLGASAKGSSAY